MTVSLRRMIEQRYGCDYGPASWKPKRTALAARGLQLAKSLLRSEAMSDQTDGQL